jgi:Domain of unknown function (DUF4331)
MNMSNPKQTQAFRRRPLSLAARAAAVLLMAAICLPSQASHHNDSALAKKDSRLNLTDLYVFPTRDAAFTVFVLNVVKDAGRDGARTLHPDASYAIDIDVDGDGREDLRLQFRFDVPAADGTQAYSVWRVDSGASGKPSSTQISSGKKLGEASALAGGGRAWAGIAGDAFAANAVGYFKLLASVQAGKADFSVFDKPVNYFAEMDVISLVVEVPNTVFKKRELTVWGSIDLKQDGQFHQVSRWGNVLTAFIFTAQGEDADAMNQSKPVQDRALHQARAAACIASIVSAAGTSTDPKAYGELVAARLMPLALPYRVGTPATYGIGAINGRALSDDSFDVIMSTVTNRALNDGVAPGGIRADFPYVPVSRRLAPWVSGQ